MRNAERLAVRERQKRELAVAGLKRVIGVAINASQEWNPEIERVTTAIIIEAENALREIDGRKQVESPTRSWVQSAKDLWELQARQFRTGVLWLWVMLNTDLRSLKAFGSQKSPLN